MNRPAVYDRTTDGALPSPVMTARAGTVLISDGVFPMRPELIDRWDLRMLRVGSAPSDRVGREPRRRHDTG